MDYFRGRLHAIRSHFHPATEEEGAPVSAVKTPANVPSHEDVAGLAYSFWEARGRQGGSALDDWLRAERELKQRK
jgi:hypothetical protein